MANSSAHLTLTALKRERAGLPGKLSDTVHVEDETQGAVRQSQEDIFYCCEGSKVIRALDQRVEWLLPGAGVGGGGQGCDASWCQIPIVQISIT